VVYLNVTLFFSALNGDALWKSDGTAAGTIPVKAFTGPYGSIPSQHVDVNGTLFFTHDDGVNGLELWKSDGTAAGTVLVKDINPDPFSASAPNFLTNVNGTLFFSAFSPSGGVELWKSDGTEAGTAQVKDINPGGGHSSPG